LRHPAWYLEHCRFAATHRYVRSRVENGSALRKPKPTLLTDAVEKRLENVAEQ
jgi:hypothetical protein